MKNFLILSAIALMACHMRKHQVQIQGLSGFVYRQTGNQMPSPGRVQNKSKGVKCRLYIYLPATLSNVTGNNPVFTAVNTKLVAIANTDSAGHYDIKLPAGKYSVFIKNNSSFFADESNGSGIINPIEIVQDKATVKNWFLRSGAVY